MNRIIIAGSRHINLKLKHLQAILDHFDLEPIEIVSGGAKGVDLTGEIYASQNHIPLVKFSPDWEKFDKAAGPIRNKQMAEYADSLLIIWDGDSRGSADMKMNMLKMNKPIYEVILKG